LLPPLNDNLVSSNFFLKKKDEGGFGDHSDKGKELSKT